jgi:hypothetical protein
MRKANPDRASPKPGRSLKGCADRSRPPDMASGRSEDSRAARAGQVTAPIQASDGLGSHLFGGTGSE